MSPIVIRPRAAVLRRRVAASLTAAFLLLALSCAPVLAADTAGPQDDSASRDYRIGPQNVIQIKIFGEASTNQIYRVDEGGFIKHALVGRVKVGGLTITESEKEMEQRLDGDYIINPKVTIFVLEYSKFSVMGEVVRPGIFEITGRVTAIEAISMAGGFTRVANPRGVKVMRTKDGSESTIEIDTTHITDRGDRSKDVDIEANDVVVVPKSFF